MEEKAKKALLSLGMMTTVVSPVTTVIACSSSETVEELTPGDLTPGDLSDLVDSNKLPSEVTEEEVVNHLSDIGVEVTTDDVSVEGDDETGTLLLTISYTNADGVAQENPVELTGFQTEAERDTELMQAALQDLEDNPDDLEKALVDPDALPDTVAEADVAAALNSLNDIVDLTEGDITALTADNNTGELAIEVTYDNETYTIGLYGFQTEAEHDAALMHAALQDLEDTPDDLEKALVDPNTLPDTVAEADVAAALNSLNDIVDLTEGDITILTADNTTGELIIEVAYDNETYTIGLSGFQTQAERDEEIYAKSEVEKQVEQELISQVVDSNIYGTFVDENNVLEIINFAVDNWNTSGESVSTLETFTNEDLLFKSNDAEGTLTITILDYHEEGDDLTITLSGFKCYATETEVDNNAYESQNLPEWFTVPETITTIGDYAFYEATFLGDFTLDNTQVETIGDYAFNTVELPDGFALPDTLKTIGKSTFANVTFLGTFSLPDSVTTTGDYAFNNVILPDGWGLNIPDALTSLGEVAFRNTTIAAGESVPDGIESIPNEAFEETTFLGNFGLPNSVITIGDQAFDEATFLGEFTLANTQVETIGGSAFSSVELPATFALPDSLTTIGNYAFYKATFLGDFTLDNTQVETIGSYVFSNSTFLGDFSLPDSVTSIGEHAFSYATFKGDFFIFEGVNEIGYAAFHYTIFSQPFQIPDTVTTIGDYAFAHTSLPAGYGLNIPDSLTYMGTTAFNNTTIAAGESTPTGITVIPYASFADTTFLGAFEISDGITEIDDGAFQNATFLGGLSLPKSLTSIGVCAFWSATFLGDFTLDNTQVETIGVEAFENTTLPDGFNLPDTVTTIGDEAFVNTTLPAGFAIPENATIGTDAFKDVQMADNLTWYDENNVEQTPDATPQAGWYIAPKS